MRRNVTFRTEKKYVSDKRKQFTIIFVALIAVVMVFSIVAILIKYDFDFKTALSGEAQLTTEPESLTESTENVSLDKTYLLWCNDTQIDSLSLLMTVNVKVPKNDITVKSYSPETVIEFNNGNYSFSEIYKLGGIKLLQTSFEKYSGLKIDNYVGSTQETFKSMLDTIGSFSIVTKEQIEYRSSDFNLILMKGNNSMRGDTIYKYFRYLGIVKPNGLDLQVDLFKTILDQSLTEKNFAKRNKIFAKISNTLSTDLSILDFTKDESAIEYLIMATSN